MSLRFTDYRYFKPKTHYSSKIALKVDVNNDTETVIFSFAVCSADDNFSKEVARNITDERMNSGCVLGGQYDRDMTLVENCRHIATRYLDAYEQRYPKGSEEYEEHRTLRNLTNNLVNAFYEVEMNQAIERIEHCLNVFDANGKIPEELCSVH